MCGETQDAKKMQEPSYVLLLKPWRVEDAAVYLSRGISVRCGYGLRDSEMVEETP